MLQHNAHIIHAATLGQGWMQVSKYILESGVPARWEGAPMTEVRHLNVVVDQPDSKDPFILSRGDQDWLAWMHKNFTDYESVKELGYADSYATRLFNYAGSGRDQVQWAADWLLRNREARNATITTFQPLTDTTYIPCVSLLDFWIPEDRLELSVYAHGLDFGKKAYGNLVELASLQETVAQKVNVPVGRLVLHVKTAHIYEPEYEFMKELVASSAM